MAHTNIPWATDVWNPVTGCEPISEGCEHCYARRMARRLAGRCGYPASPNEFSVTFHPERLELPMKWKTPRKVFVNSMGDLFHKDVQLSWFWDVWRTIVDNPRHTFILLTKRPENMAELLRDHIIPAHIWLGVTAENQARANERIPILLSIPAAVHFVSVEPMLTRMDLTDVLYLTVRERDTRAHKLSLVICGPETGPGARECKPEWIEDLAQQCQAAEVPFFDKRKNYIRREWPG